MNGSVRYILREAGRRTVFPNGSLFGPPGKGLRGRIFESSTADVRFIEESNNVWLIDLPRASAANIRFVEESKNAWLIDLSGASTANIRVVRSEYSSCRNSKNAWLIDLLDFVNSGDGMDSRPLDPSRRISGGRSKIEWFMTFITWAIEVSGTEWVFPHTSR